MRRLTLFVPLEEAEAAAIDRARSQMGARDEPFAVLRRSLDARKGRPIGHLIELELGAPEPTPPRPTSRVRPSLRVVVVGTGPAGTFAAQSLSAAGAQVTLVERGQPVQPRRHDLAQLTRGQLVPDSNYCFGEGGAGTFSDGKLYTRVKDRQGVQEVLASFVEHGAPADIAVDSRPHIGSNRLPKILVAQREALEKSGVEYVWGDAVTELLVIDARVRGVRCASGRELVCDAVVMAPGHSARPLYEALHAQAVALEAKGFAVGARIEHLQAVIDRAQYGAAAGHPRLPPSFYQLSAQVDDRGVYSFCMCPGGWVVPSSTEEGLLCTNGMSLSRRDSPLANAALVVALEPRDWRDRHGDGPLGGIALQREIEARAFELGGGGYVAAAQRVEDFLADRPSSRASSRIVCSTYRPRVAPGDVRGALPPLVGAALAHGLRRFGRMLPGFADAEAHFVGAETRSSSPVRILRDARTLASPSHAGLYPSGEGAGYAGGIVSAAIDGLRVARAIIEQHAD
jgi:uncharacterized protein